MRFLVSFLIYTLFFYNALGQSNIHSPGVIWIPTDTLHPSTWSDDQIGAVFDTLLDISKTPHQIRFPEPENVTLFFDNKLLSSDTIICYLNAKEKKTITFQTKSLEIKNISEINLIPHLNLAGNLLLNGVGVTKKAFGNSGSCLININCEEGQKWIDQKRSVVRIKSRVQGRILQCSGTVINNTQRDNTPYILTAEHCGHILNTDIYASSSDLNSWLFDFDYESISCGSPSDESDLNYWSLTGAQLIAQSKDRGGDFGSDFFLLKLNDSIPRDKKVYYAGWDNRDIASPSGIGIHHPNYDIKKISTYSTNIISAPSIKGTPDAHWEMTWSPTANGLSVTEGGSSGSPLFNQNGLVIGILNSGLASCSDNDQPDYYGKISYCWESNGEEAYNQLKPFLDPLDLGVSQLEGGYHSDSIYIPEPVITEKNTPYIYPNPVSDILKIKEDNIQLVVIYDALGNTLKTSYDDNQIDVSNLSSGYYMIRVLSDNRDCTFAFSKL